jgi:hypothetical protein
MSVVRISLVKERIQQLLCSGISGSHGGEYEDNCLLG